MLLSSCNEWVVHQAGNGETWEEVWMENFLSASALFFFENNFLWLLSEQHTHNGREKSYFEWFLRLFRVNCCSSTWHDLTMFMNMEIQFTYTKKRLSVEWGWWGGTEIENLFMLIWLMMFFDFFLFLSIADELSRYVFCIILLFHSKCVIVFHFM